MGRGLPGVTGRRIRRIRGDSDCQYVRRGIRVASPPRNTTLPGIDFAKARVDLSVLLGIRPDGQCPLGLNRQRREKRSALCESWVGAIAELCMATHTSRSIFSEA